MEADFTKWFEDWKQACGKWNNSMHGGARDAWDHQQVRVAALEAELGVAREQLKGAGMDGPGELPWWYPKRTDQVWLDRIRGDYPDNAGRSDEELREIYADGSRYATLWDHTGDALEQFEKLADAYLDLVKAIGSTGDDS